MSHRYYSTRLYFFGKSGIAKLRGKGVELFELPKIFSADVTGVDYAPEAGYAWVVRNNRTEAMTRCEIASVDEFLVRIVTKTS